MKYFVRELKKWGLRLYCRIVFDHMNVICLNDGCYDYVLCQRCSFILVNKCDCHKCGNHPKDKLEETKRGLVCRKCGNYVK